MTGNGEKEQRRGIERQEGSASGVRRISFDALRRRAQQLSLRDNWSVSIFFWSASIRRARD